MNRSVIHKKVFQLGTLCFAFGIMFGAITTSLPQILLGLNWLFEGQFQLKWQRFKKQPWIWFIMAYWFWLWAGVFYSEDSLIALQQVKIQLPLVSWALIYMTSEPFDAGFFKRIIQVFLTGVLLSFIYGLGYQLYKTGFWDARSLSRFMSHIRFSQYQVLGFFLLLYLWHQSSKTKSDNIFAVGLILLSSIVFFSGEFSAMLMLIFAIPVLIFHKSYNPKWKWLLGLIVAALLTASLGTISWMYFRYFKIKSVAANKIHSKSRSGRPLIHFAPGSDAEGGVFIYQNIQMEELKKSWNARCPDDTFSFSPAHNLIRYEVLIRYLASMQELKDSAGVSHLSSIDLGNIKSGYHFQQERNWIPILKRCYELLREINDLQLNKDVNGHSIWIRYYFWKTGLLAFKQTNLWIGTGPGDIQSDMNRIYKQQIQIKPTEYKKPHQQFITLLLGSGFIGLMLFSGICLYPFFRFSIKSNPFILYWLALCLGLCYEDTVTSQAGVSLVAWSICFIWQYEHQIKIQHK